MAFVQSEYTEQTRSFGRLVVDAKGWFSGSVSPRSHIVLERNATFITGDSGYSSWDELPDGNVVAVDYTGSRRGRRHPLLRAYRLRP